MSTRVGIIAEGPIDLALLPPILRKLAEERAGVSWPVQIADAFEWLQMRPRGHGGVWMAIRRIVRVLQHQPEMPYAFIVILLDRRTQKIQKKVRKLIAGKDRFVLAVAQEEIEAWWLGDRTNTLAWLDFRNPPAGTRYAAADYLAERHDKPKRTLHELTEQSARLDRVYGEGNLDLARDFAERWDGNVRLKEIETQCPQQFPPFCRETTQAFRRTKSRGSRLVQGTLGLN
ncbi:MAG: DUF4276 family protein [Verrucomicrobia bacterium]|nr:DUF4276 family protein [Verrucomicrobiota bacterium]